MADSPLISFCFFSFCPKLLSGQAAAESDICTSQLSVDSRAKKMKMGRRKRRSKRRRRRRKKKRRRVTKKRRRMTISWHARLHTVVVNLSKYLSLHLS